MNTRMCWLGSAAFAAIALAPHAAAAPPAAPTTPGAREAEELFQSVFGAACREVAATAAFADDVELARKVLQAAVEVADRPAALALFCEKACELGGKAPEGYETAIDAMRLLADRQPGAEPACWEKIALVLQRVYLRETKFEKLVAGERLVVESIRRADRLRAAGQYAEAAGTLGKALPVARTIRSPQAALMLEMQKFLVSRSRFAAQAAAAEKQLAARPDDRAARETLVRTCLLEFDRPDKAGDLVNEACNEVLRTYVPLAARPPDQVDPNVHGELGLWLKAEAAKASPEGRMLVYRRAGRYLRSALARRQPGSASHMKARLALQDVDAFLHGARQAYPLKPVPTALPARLLARGLARNRLPLDYQLQVLQKDLKDTNNAADIQARFVSDAARNEIHAAEMPWGAKGLVCLDALAALPLRSLTLQRCPGLTGDLRALAGMPLKVLDLSECTGLRSLHGLEGAPLETLDLTGCTGLQDASALRGLKLTSLKIGASPGVGDLELLRGMPLTTLTLTGFAGVKDLSALTETRITGLSVAASGLEGLHGVEPLKLTGLIVSECPGLRSVAALKGQAALSVLILPGCARLTDIEGLAGAPLSRLSLAGASGLTGGLSALKAARLTELNLAGCAGLSSLAGIEGQPIESLNLTGCRGLASLAGIEALPIKVLSLPGCTSLPDDLRPLARLPLTYLNLSDCSNLTSFKGLEGIPLESLTAANCRRLTGDLTALRGSKLTDLDLSGCGELTSLTGVGGLRLRSLDISGCAKLTAAEYAMLEGMSSLVRFRPGSKELGAAVLKAIADRQAKARKARR